MLAVKNAEKPGNMWAVRYPRLTARGDRQDAYFIYDTPEEARAKRDELLDIVQHHHGIYVSKKELPWLCRRNSAECPRKRRNWLRVLGAAELPHIDQGVCHQFHAKMPLLDVFKPQEEPLEFILPRECPIHTSPQGMDGGIEQPLAPALGALAVAGILCDVGDHAGIENAFAIVRGIKASIEIQIGSSKIQPDRFGHPLQGFQPIREQHHVRHIDRCYGEWR